MKYTHPSLYACINKYIHICTTAKNRSFFFWCHFKKSFVMPESNSCSLRLLLLFTSHSPRQFTYAWKKLFTWNFIYFIDLKRYWTETTRYLERLSDIFLLTFCANLAIRKFQKDIFFSIHICSNLIHVLFNAMFVRRNGCICFIMFFCTIIFRYIALRYTTHSNILLFLSLWGNKFYINYNLSTWGYSEVSIS